MTTLHNFEHSTKTKVVGSAPWGQLELLQPLNFNSMLKRDELPKQSEFRLKGNSRLTDLLSCFSIDILNCFIVSSKMHSILKDFNLQEHQWANCTIRKKEKTWDYHLLRFAQSRDKKRRPLLYCPEIVDWKNSVFFEDSHARFGGIKGNEPILKIDSYDDYLKVRAEYYRQFDEHENVDLTIGVMKFAFNEEYMEKNNPDMCWLFPLHSNPLISERLKTALEENDITGIETMEINSFKFRKLNSNRTCASSFLLFGRSGAAAHHYARPVETLRATSLQSRTAIPFCPAAPSGCPLQWPAGTGHGT